MSHFIIELALEDLKKFPSSVYRAMGYALFLAQAGEKHPRTKMQPSIEFNFFQYRGRG